MRRCLQLICLSLLLSCRAFATGYVFDYSSNCSKAYQYYISLHMAQGSAMIMQEIKANPYNLMATYVADYEDCLVLLLNGDKADYDQRKAHFEERLDIMEKGD